MHVSGIMITKLIITHKQLQMIHVAIVIVVILYLTRELIAY